MCEDSHWDKGLKCINCDRLMDMSRQYIPLKCGYMIQMYIASLYLSVCSYMYAYYCS